MGSINDARAQRGARIAACGGVTRTGPESWRVCSQTKRGTNYAVRLIPGGASCTCPDYKEIEVQCKHIWAVMATLAEEVAASATATPSVDGPATPVSPREAQLRPESMEGARSASGDRSGKKAALAPESEVKKERLTYSQNWPKYNRAQMEEKRIFERLLHDLCGGIPQPDQNCGRRRLPLSDVIGAALAKVYATSSGRRFMTSTYELTEKGVLAQAPHYNTVYRYLGDPALTPLLKTLIDRTSAPLKSLETQFAQDGSGFSTHVYRRWFDHRHGEAKEKTQHEWVNAQVFVGTATKVVVLVEVFAGRKGKGTGESPHLLPMTAKAVLNGWDVKEVSADKAYSSVVNQHGLAAMGIAAFIPFKDGTGASPRGTSIWNNAWHLFNLEKEKFLLHYHRRSNVESVFSMVKRKFGQFVRAKTPVAQTNEVLLKFIVHNIVCLVTAIIDLGLEPRLAGQEAK